MHSLGLFEQAAWNTPSWSISTEYYTYVVFALAAAVAGRRLLWAAAAIAAFCAVALLAWPERHLATALDFGIFRCGFGFMLGCMATRWAAMLLQYTRGWRGFGVWAELAALAAVALVFYTGFTPWNLLAPAVFAAAVVVFAQERGPISALLKARPFVSLGRLSYSIYMVHLPLLLIGFERLQRLVFAKWGGGITLYTDGNGDQFPILAGPPLLGDAMIVLYLTLVVMIASVTYRTIEEPWRRRFAAWADAGARNTPAHGGAVLQPPPA